MEDICVICRNPCSTGESVVLGEKGVQGITKAAKKRSDENVYVHVGQKVHKECRRCYILKKNITRKRKSNEDHDIKYTLRSGSTIFTFKDDCLFCGKSIAKTCRQRGYKVFHSVQSVDFQNDILQKCKERNDSWGNTVMARIEYSCDLLASEAVYHQYCSVVFRQGREMFEEGRDPPAKKVRGRQKDELREVAFTRVIQFLKDDNFEQITVNDLVSKMKEYLNDENEPFIRHYMKSRLMEYFGDEIVIAEINGKTDVVSFRNKASYLLHTFYSIPKNENSEEEKIRLIKAAAQLIKNDINNLATSKDFYPTQSDMNNADTCFNYLPTSLQQFLKVLYVDDSCRVKQAAIGQAMIQAVRPRKIIAPLQLGLGIQCYHHFGSRFLIDSLNSLGFCCSYNEVQQYENNAAITNNIDIPGYEKGQFVQFVADNVDHNIRTLDGHNTFHGMGIIASVTPGTNVSLKIPRLKLTGEDVKTVGKIKLHFYNRKGTADIQYCPLIQRFGEDETKSIDLLWKTSWLLKSVKSSWCGTMQMIHKSGVHPGKSSVVFMPMIDLNPSDETCVYSTLKFVSEQAKQYDVTPVLTFDQPLWWKALNIIKSEPVGSDLQRFVLRLGGLHIQMSFLGCIGHIMSDSGLQDVLETIYAENAVSHMLTGKAIARAIRGHGIVDMALQSLLFKEVFGFQLLNGGNGIEEKEMGEKDVTDDRTWLCDSNSKKGACHTENANISDRPDCNDIEPENDIKYAGKLFDQVVAGEIDILTACSSPVVKRIQEKINKHCSTLKEGRTGKLWLQYMKMVEIMRSFVKAERTGNWKLHLQSLFEMLPFFAAAGHNLYAKCTYIYLMEMQDLQSKSPDTYEHFMEGYHVIRRSQRFWGGLSTDLVIEQMLMRSLKTTGGLTRGRGLTETQRTKWLLSRPSCCEINDAMQQMSETIYSSSEQHKDCGKARQIKDQKDTSLVTEYFEARNPFCKNPDLRSIASGVVSANSNADDAEVIGKLIINKMTGNKVQNFTFRKCDKVVCMNDKAGLKIQGESVQIDPQLLFQRLVTVMQTSEDSKLPAVFSHELCSFPPALFESQHLLREADKYTLADAIRMKVKPDEALQNTDLKLKNVIDGGNVIAVTTMAERVQL